MRIQKFENLINTAKLKGKKGKTDQKKIYQCAVKMSLERSEF